MTAARDTPARTILSLRIAVLLTALALVLAFALLIRETAYLFAAFMILGPLLVAAAAALLVWHILAELRAKKVL